MTEILKALCTSVQGDPVFMRRVNGGRARTRRRHVSPSAASGSGVAPFGHRSLRGRLRQLISRRGHANTYAVTPAADPWSDSYAWWMPPRTAETCTIPRHASSCAGMNNDAAAFGGVIWITADVWHACEPEGTSL